VENEGGVLVFRKEIVEKKRVKKMLCLHRGEESNFNDFAESRACNTGRTGNSFSLGRLPLLQKSIMGKKKGRKILT